MTGGFGVVPIVGRRVSQIDEFVEAKIIVPACVGVARKVTLPPLTPSTYMSWYSSFTVGRLTPFAPWAVSTTQTSTWLPAAICG